MKHSYSILNLTFLTLLTATVLLSACGGSGSSSSTSQNLNPSVEFTTDPGNTFFEALLALINCDRGDLYGNDDIIAEEPEHDEIELPQDDSGPDSSDRNNVPGTGPRSSGGSLDGTSGSLGFMIVKHDQVWENISPACQDACQVLREVMFSLGDIDLSVLITEFLIANKENTGLYFIQDCLND